MAITITKNKRNRIIKRDIYEVKKDKARYDENLLKQKVDYMLQVCPELKKMEIHLACLSLEDM